MSNRRNFLKKSAAATALFSGLGWKSWAREEPFFKAKGTPTIISTWIHGIEANAESWQVLSKGGSITDAVEAGVRVEEGESSLSIFPFQEVRDENAGPVTINTFKDHRVAMSFAILGCLLRRPSGKPWMHIEDPECCGKTFPDFFDVLESLYRKSHDV